MPKYVSAAHHGALISSYSGVGASSRYKPDLLHTPCHRPEVHMSFALRGRFSIIYVVIQTSYFCDHYNEYFQMITVYPDKLHLIVHQCSL